MSKIRLGEKKFKTQNKNILSYIVQNKSKTLVTSLENYNFPMLGSWDLTVNRGEEGLYAGACSVVFRPP